MRSPARALGVLSLSVTCLVGVPAAGSADHHAYPSKRQVQRAQAAVARTTQDVGAIQAQLALADQQLASLNLEAEQATEAYNGARWRLLQARHEANRSAAKALRVERRLKRQRERLGRVLAAHYQSGNNLSQLGVLLSSDGAATLLNQYSAFSGAAQTMQAGYERFAAANTLAKVFRAEARRAVDQRTRAANDAARLKDIAQAAVSRQAGAVAAITSRKDELLQQLAAAQNISVQMARQRQQALAAIRRQQARAAAIAEAKAAARAAARAKHKAKQNAQQNAQPQPAPATPTASPTSSPATPTPTPPPAPTPPPTPSPPPPPPSPSGGAQAAIDFAYAQLGDPYVWGAAGPDAWDCSGLTMGAWGAAGVALPHYAAAQYYVTTPVSFSDLQPGDLLFWATDASNPDTIHHVAIYLGNDQMIQAPRTGLNVEVSSIWSWIAPNLFSRP